MKKTKLLLIVLIGYTSFITGQNLKQYEVFKLDKIDNLLVLSTAQKENIKVLFEGRKKEFSETVDWHTRKAINAKYFTKILENLSKSQKELLVAQFGPSSSVVKPYFEIVEKFPISYQAILKSKLQDLEDQENYLIGRYVFDEYTLKEKAQVVYQKRYRILKEEQVPLNKTLEIVNKSGNCYGMTVEDLNLLKEYEFYVRLNTIDQKYNMKIGELIQMESFPQLEVKLSNCITENSLKYLGNLYEGKDSVTQNDIRDTIQKKFLIHYQNLVAEKQSLGTKNKGFKPFLLARKVIENRKSELLALSKENEKQKFFKKADSIGLAKNKAKEVFNLISQRDADIKAYQKYQMKKATEYSLSVSGNSEVKTPYQIKLKFSEDLTKLLSKEEYALLLVDSFKKPARKKADQQLKNVLSGQDIEKQDLEKLDSLVYRYYLNHEVTTAYYSFNRALQQQKLGSLTYKFERKFRSLVAEMGIVVGNAKKVDSNTFQWN